jgi:hypothetical protein
MDRVVLFLKEDAVTPDAQIEGPHDRFRFEAYGVVFEEETPREHRPHTRIFPWHVVREVHVKRHAEDSAESP